MIVTFDNFKLLADKDLYEAMVKKYGAQSYGDDKLAIKTNNSFASWMIAEKVGDKYKIVPITSQNNERQSLQMEAYWTVLKEFPIKEFNDVPQFYRQWFVNRGLMKESKMNEKFPEDWQYNFKKLTDKIIQVWEKGKLLSTSLPKNKAQKLVQTKKAFVVTGNSINLIGENKMRITKSRIKEIIREEYLIEAKKTIRVFWNSKFRYYDNFEQVIKDFSKEEIDDANFSLLLGATVIYSFLGSGEKALKNKLKKEMK